MKYCVIPEPYRFEIKSSDIVFDIFDETAFEAEPSAEKSFNSLISFLEEFFTVFPSGLAKGKIRLEISGKGESEGYSLKVERGRVLLSGNDEKGLFYAVQTLKQLLFCGDGKLTELEIEDKPRFRVRGFMLDCARHFFSVEAVKQFIDMMAFHKLNEFHWHLSDDQGFRCQLEGKLLLTEIGSYRSNTNFNNEPHEGYYTKADIKEIVDYAHNRYIKVIPEIDSPGHVMAMLAAYPELACFLQDYSVSTFWGIKHDVLCVGKESTFEFMQELFDELTDIFTDGVIHLGGDEVPTVRWESCPHCQKRMKDEGLTSEEELHTYYLDRMATYLRNKGTDVRMWNDRVKEKMVDKSVTWQLWNGEMNEQDVVKELNDGRKFVISCGDYYYLSFPYALTSLEKCYNFEPVFDGLTEEGEKNILGTEACLWTEFVPDMITADKMTYPRIAAICESAWSMKDKKNFDLFKEKLGSYYGILGETGINAASLKKTSPEGIKKLAGKIYWKRRSLYWGAHHNIMSDIRVKRILNETKKENENNESYTDA